MLARKKLLRKALLGILLLELFAIGVDLNSCLTIFILCGIGGFVLYPARVFIPRFLAGTFSYASVLLLLRLTSDIQEIPSGICLATLSCGMLLATFFFILSQQFSGPGRVRCALRFLLGIIFFLPPTPFWAYGLHTHAFLSADTVTVVLQTNPAEALQYLMDTMTPQHLILAILLLFLFFLGAFWFTRNASARKFSFPKGQVLVPCTIMLFFLLCIPSFSMNSMYGVLLSDTLCSLKDQRAFAAEAPAREAELEQHAVSSGRNGLFVLVIGESENRLHMSAYGYNRDTTPWLREKAADDDCLLFTNAYANYVCTVQALSYALTEKNQYTDLPLAKAATLPEAAHAAGFHTIMCSNQGKFGLASTTVSAIGDECDDAHWLHPQQFSNLGQEYMDFRVEDGDIVNVLKSLSLPQEGKTLLILHLIGSHNNYRYRCPEDFSPFGTATLTDQYDNTIIYNDEIMRQIHEQVKDLPNFQCLVYLSDHSEGIDHGQMHDSNCYIPEMTYIPFYILASKDFRVNHPDQWHQLSLHRTAYFTNDLLYDLMCSLMGIRTENMQPENDITHPEYDANPARFRTEHGTKPITPPEPAAPQP